MNRYLFAMFYIVQARFSIHIRVQAHIRLHSDKENMNNTIFDYSALKHWMTHNDMSIWANQLDRQINQKFNTQRYGDLPSWLASFDAMPKLTPSDIDFSSSVRIGHTKDCRSEEQQQLLTCLQALIPWRKGPFEFYGIDVDTEWRSDWKWQRIAHKINIEQHQVLDIGCGNGYHMLRMLGAGAERVLGIDPSPRFVVQFEMIKKMLGKPIAADLLPLGIEDIPQPCPHFDSVFSMGVLYHRKSPIDHLYELKACLKPKGQLILETLIVDGNDHQILVPEGRYAKMRNVWFLPSVKALQGWLRKVGFKTVEVLDINQTTVEEQRSTDWMRFESLPNFLDPKNSQLTIEGHPAPKRAALLATL